MNNSSTKNAEIKIRIHKQDKTILQELAKKQNMTLSDYILTKCFTETDSYIRMIPDAVETWDTYNKILRIIKDTHDSQLLMNVKSILDHALQNHNLGQG